MRTTGGDSRPERVLLMSPFNPALPVTEPRFIEPIAPHAVEHAFYLQHRSKSNKMLEGSISITPGP